MKTELLPCPFCGGAADYLHGKPDTNPYDPESPTLDWWLAGCTTCGVWLPNGGDLEDKSNAAALWNKRSNIATPNPAVALGRMTSARKAEAARRNGTKGGRPRKTAPK